MLIATPKSASANSYATAAEAVAYFALRLNGADWLAYGTAQVETATVVGTIGASGAGNATVIVTAAGMPNSPKTISVAVANSDTASQVAGKIRTALAADVDVSAFFAISGSNASVILTALIPTFNDATTNLSIDNGTCTGLTAALTSANTTAGTGEREIALIQGTCVLELLRYAGRKTTTTQALKMPRSGMFDEDRNEYDEDVVPILVKQALYEMALALQINPDFGSSTGLEMFSSIKIERDTQFDLRQGGGPSIPSQAMAYLMPFLLSGSQARVIRA